jgi:hypothetical protein
MLAACGVALVSPLRLTFAEEKDLPIPPDLRPAIEQAIELGRAIYLHDKASAIATDALAAKIGPLEGKDLGGYLPVQEAAADGTPGPAFLVSFFTRERSPRIAYRIRVPMAQGQPPTVESLSPPQTPSPMAATLIRARQTALASVQPFQQPINPVVFPAEAIGKRGILVYLIAGTGSPNVAVLGKHYRVVVSEDGGTVLETLPLSRTVIEMSTVSCGEGCLEALAVTHLVTDAPLETHVFASLLNRVPIYIATKRGIWCVDRDSIRLVSAEPPQGEGN